MSAVNEHQILCKDLCNTITVYYQHHLHSSPYSCISITHIFVVEVISHLPCEISIVFSLTEPGTAPRNVQVRPLSSSTMVIQWDEPETPNGQVTVGRSGPFFLLSHSLQWKTQTSVGE